MTRWSPASFAGNCGRADHRPSLPPGSVWQFLQTRMIYHVTECSSNHSTQAYFFLWYYSFVLAIAKLVLFLHYLYSQYCNFLRFCSVLESCTILLNCRDWLKRLTSGGFRNLERGVQPLAREAQPKIWGCQAHFRSRKELNILKQFWPSQTSGDQ